jgi:hypothetical protein
MQEVVRSFVLPGECDINHPHLTTPRVMLQIIGAPIAGRGTEKESGFDARVVLAALPSWKARFQFPLPAHRMRWVCHVSAGRG